MSEDTCAGATSTGSADSHTRMLAGGFGTETWIFDAAGAASMMGESLSIIFAPEGTLNFDEVIFNTEAHPFKIALVKK